MTMAQRDQGRALGRMLASARGDRSAAEVARLAGVSLDTLRKIERGVICGPSFFTVAALARVLGLDLTAVASELAVPVEMPETVGAPETVDERDVA